LAVQIGVKVLVWVDVGEWVGVKLFVTVGVWVGVEVVVEVKVLVGDKVWVKVFVAVGVLVGVGILTPGFRGTAVKVAVRVGVGGGRKRSFMHRRSVPQCL